MLWVPASGVGSSKPPVVSILSLFPQMPLDFPKQPLWECGAQLAGVCPALTGPLPLPHTPGGWEATWRSRNGGP